MEAFFGKGSANWSGNFRHGNATITSESGAFKTIGYASVQHRKNKHTCPDELMAVAQAVALRAKNRSSMSRFYKGRIWGCRRG